MDERKTSRSRRRASRILAEKRRKGPPVSCDDESPTRERAKPPRRKKKEALYEEDIIEGFAILSYIKYEDIEVSLNGGKPPKKKGTTNNSTNGVVTEPKVPEVIIKQEEPPAPPLSVKVNHVDKTNQDPSTSDDSGREKEKIKREVAVIKRDPESEDNRVSDASSRCSSGRGYLCDSEDDDKNSDSGSVLFSASPPAVRKLDVANEAVNGHGGGGERVPGAGITVKSNGSPRPPSPAAPPPPLALALPPQQPHPPPKPSPNHFSPVSIPNGVTTKVERVSPPPASIVSAHSGHHRVVPPPAPAPPPVAYSLPSRPGYPPGYPLPQPPHAHSLPPHPLPGHSQPPHPHPQPSPTACAPTPPSVPAPPPVSAYHPPLYAPYNSTPYLPPTSLHQPSRSPIGLKPITTSVGLVVTTATTTTSHRDTINAPLIGRTHSPRGHSPTRERDSYSSNVSSLSRGSMGTPSSMPPYSAPHHPSVVPPVASVVAPSAQPSSLPYKQPSPWVSSSNPPQPTAPGRTGLTPHHHPFAPPMFPPNPVAAPPVSSAPAPPPAPNPFSAESLFQSNQGDLLRRELDSRFLATQDRGPYIRTEMHHHQHQHTHVHQHTTPIIPPPPPTLFSSPMVNFKDMPKGAPVDSPFYRQSLGFSGYPSYTPSLIHPSFGSATPFAPPTHLPTFTPKQLTEPSKPKTVKTGKWNAMHVRVAWEIYHHQQKSGGGEGKVGPLIGKSDFMRPPTHMFGPPPPHPFTAPTHPHRTVQQAYDPTPSHTFPPTMGSSVFGRYPPAGPTFPTALPSFPHAPAIHDPWGRIQPRGVPPQGFPPPSPWGLKPEVMDEREREKERERSRERERQRREEKQRQRMVGVPSKVRDRSPLREPPPQAHPMLPATTVSKEEEAAMISRTQHYLAARQPPRPLPPHFPQSPWDPYRYDPLRYNPLMAALQEEEQRAKLFGYGGAPPPSLAHLRSKAPSPSHRLPPAPHGAHPKDDPTQPR